jgi:hypothetical protein
MALDESYALLYYTLLMLLYHIEQYDLELTPSLQFYFLQHPALCLDLFRSV